jgi:hypothetical protein
VLEKTIVENTSLEGASLAKKTVVVDDDVISVKQSESSLWLLGRLSSLQQKRESS